MEHQSNHNKIDDKEYSLSEIYHTLRKHLKLIISVFITVLFITLYFTLISKPIYKSSGIIMVSKDQESMSLLDMNLGNDLNYIDNEIQILKSRTTSDLVIKKLLNSNLKNDFYILGTKKYEPSIFRTILTLGLLDGFGKKDDIEFNHSDSLIYIFSKNLRESLSVSNTRGTDAIIISIKSNSPSEAAYLVNALIETYKERDLEWVTGEMHHLKSFLIDQLEDKEKELKSIEEELKIFQEREKIFGLNDNSQLLLENLTQFETKYNNILAEIDISHERENYINKQLTSDEKELSKKVSNTINERLAALQDQLLKTENRLIALTASNDSKNLKAITDLNNQLNNIKQSIENETRNLITEGISVADPIMYRQGLMDSVISLRSITSSLESRAIAYKKLIDEYDKKLSSLPEKVLEYTRLERVRTIYAETYSFMSKKLEDARIGEASKLSKVRLIDKAIPNAKPIKPNKMKNIIMGSLLGIFLGIGISFIIEMLDNTIKTIEQIERRGLALLTIIPSIGNIKKKKAKIYKNNNKNVEKLQRRLITHEDPKSPVSEAYRSLRTSLMYTDNDTKSKVLLVSSPGPGEGKTTTIANLAITYANLGKKVLLIDSDLRKPVIHNVFKIDKSPGLTSFLSSNADIDSIINKTEIENLDVVSSGINPPNPSELLDSNKMEEFLSLVREKYDFILFDSPPLIAVTDPYVLMKHIDQFILVVRAGVTQKGALSRILESIKHSKFEITGVVMNAVTHELSYGTGYYYNYYQYYYGSSED